MLWKRGWRRFFLGAVGVVRLVWNIFFGVERWKSGRLRIGLRFRSPSSFSGNVQSGADGEMWGGGEVNRTCLDPGAFVRWRSSQ